MKTVPLKFRPAQIWPLAAPVVALLMALAIDPYVTGWIGAAVLAVVLIAAVFASLHHVEVVAERVGQPFGALVLAVAVTVIETALIVSILLEDPQGNVTLVRDSVFSVVMIVLNGITGLCVVLGAVRYKAQAFRRFGASSYLAVIVTVTTFTLVLPAFTLSAAGPVYAPIQLIFVAAVCLALYGVFLFVQTVGHREEFLEKVGGEVQAPVAHARPSRTAMLISLGALTVALGAVVLLAKALAPTMETVARNLGAPHPAAVTGAAVAFLVLLPEGVSAVRSARKDRLQDSLNLALGSALATVALTVPAVAAVMLYLGEPLVLGLSSKDMILFALTALVASLTLGVGRTTVLQGAVHLVIFAAFAFLLWIP